MESQALPKRWRQILILLVILTAVFVRGLKADSCAGVCGHGTSCINGTYCDCVTGFGVLRAAKGNSAAFCYERCKADGEECPVNTMCRTVLFRNEDVNVCDCSPGARRSASGHCLDIDECAENPNICGNNSVCANTEGNYTCTCAEGYTQKEGEEVGCSEATGAVVPTEDSSALTIGLAAGIGGLVLLAVIILVVVIAVRAINRSREGDRKTAGLDTHGKRTSNFSTNAYEDVCDQTVQQQRGVGNLTYPGSTVLPDVSGSSTDLRLGKDVRYEEVDLPPQAEQNNGPPSLFSLTGNFEVGKPVDRNEYRDVYSNHKIAHDKRKQLAIFQNYASETYPIEATYSVLSKPHVKPSSAAINTPGNYSTLYDISLKFTKESRDDLQPRQTGCRNPQGNKEIEYDTAYSVARPSHDNGPPEADNDLQNGNEYDELEAEKV